MKLLLDTHAFIWYVQGDKRLPVGVQNLIASTENEILISVVTFWELAIKISLGKLKLNQELPIVYNETLAYGFEVIPISPKSIFKLITLPMHHKDPFDRILITTAMTQSLKIISADQHFSKYESLEIIWD